MSFPEYPEDKEAVVQAIRQGVSEAVEEAFESALSGGRGGLAAHHAINQMIFEGVRDAFGENIDWRRLESEIAEEIARAKADGS